MKINASPKGQVVVIGASGQLGSDVVECLHEQQIAAIALDKATLNITDGIAIQEKITGDVSWVINCAAYTDVNRAEEFPSQAAAVNVRGVELLARRARELGAKFMHISTDFVFDGLKSTPYLESDAAHPLNIYGKTKYEGEQVAQEINSQGTWIIRTSWLYGTHGQNFVKKILTKLEQKSDIQVVSDQIGSPTSSLDLAHGMVELIKAKQSPAPGIYHFANSGQASWFEFAEEIVRLTNHTDVKVTPVSSENLASGVKRPGYSVLGTTKWIEAGFHPIRPWKVALREYLKNYSSDSENSQSNVLEM